MVYSSPHSVQMVDGGDVSVYIAALALPLRVTAVRDPTTGILTYTNEPVLWTTGSTAGKLIPLIGSSEFDTTFGKKNATFRLFNDDGWEQDKITGRNWQATQRGMYVRNTSTTNPDLDDSFKIIFENALAKEEEVYIKFKKFIGTKSTTSVGGVTTTVRRYQIEAGNAKVINFGDQAPADGLISVSATFKGQGQFIYGFEESA